MAEPLIVGIGNPFRSDDGIGPWLADALAARGRRALVHAGDGTGLMDLFLAEPALILIDATRSGQNPGTITRFDARAAPIPAEFFHYSTHRFGLAEAVETSRLLNQLPDNLHVIGVEGAVFAHGDGLSAPVRAAAETLLAQLAG